MAFSTWFPFIMLGRNDSLHLCPETRWIGQIRVTSQTECPVSVNFKFFGFFWMFKGRAVAVFALNHFVLRRHVCFVLFIMAFTAIFF